MNLSKLKSIFADKGCSKIYIKVLAPNDNSKNQIYLGGNFEILNILPVLEITSEESGKWEKERFKAKLKYSWISEDGSVHKAPNTQLILYPKYPEVRMSGFLARCENRPSELMNQRLADRLLFLGVDQTGTVLGHVVSPTSETANEFNQLTCKHKHGLFSVLEITPKGDSRSQLIDQLQRIHELGWIGSKRLDKYGNIMSCEASNCGGYTLEAELGITPNGYSEPDYLGWELKQFSVKNFERINSAVITLMTPEPTHGSYKSEGVEAFIKKYGYPDKKGRPDRMNFGGIHRIGERHVSTNLQMELIGFDTESGKIRNSNGSISLIDKAGNEAASWSFSSMLTHWNRKHNQACYVPSKVLTTQTRQYSFSNKVILGTGTDFQLFLNQMSLGNIYYDPGIKLENMSTNPKVKRRSQFRTKSCYLTELYKASEIIDVTKS